MGKFDIVQPPGVGRMASSSSGCLGLILMTLSALVAIAAFVAFWLVAS